MAKSRQDAVWDWLLTCPHIRDLYYSFGEAADGATILVPLTAFTDAFDAEFIDGGGLKHCDFTLLRFETLSQAPNSEENLNLMLDAGALADWIDAQDGAGNFPDFPADCRITRVRSLPSGAGGVAAHDAHSAQYMLGFRIEYIYQRSV